MRGVPSPKRFTETEERETIAFAVEQDETAVLDSEMDAAETSVREARLARIRAGIANGTYLVSSEQIATRLMGRLNQPSTAAKKGAAETGPPGKSRG